MIGHGLRVSEQHQQIPHRMRRNQRKKKFTIYVSGWKSGERDEMDVNNYKTISIGIANCKTREGASSNNAELLVVLPQTPKWGDHERNKQQTGY